jgi:VRR-NUC domain protein|nr:MAG TPA: Nuclease [Caudoviricetes sp.]
MREKDIENYLKESVKKIGGRTYKFTSPGNAGVPDRICIIPGGLIFFVELKAPGKITRPLQDRQIAKLRNLGCRVYVADSNEQIDRILGDYDALQTS